MRVIYSGPNVRHFPVARSAEQSSTARCDHGDERNGNRREITPEEQR